MSRTAARLNSIFADPCNRCNASCGQFWGVSGQFTGFIRQYRVVARDWEDFLRHVSDVLACREMRHFAAMSLPGSAAAGSAGKPPFQAYPGLRCSPSVSASGRGFRPRARSSLDFGRLHPRECEASAVNMMAIIVGHNSFVPVVSAASLTVAHVAPRLRFRPPDDPVRAWCETCFGRRNASGGATSPTVQSCSQHWGEALAEPRMRIDVSLGSRISRSFALRARAWLNPKSER